ncbi:hypothetical protein SAMN04488103_101218 [Gemmobacter aquatilis]|uniref:FlgN protein n=1 Tax=Gemmobacter aquatilis TaxID=933059 RepID=A0A1H7YJQ3_9RHOB|nr:hypothetical protein [Gemmobacter aquatilis]SEM46183.1 hypothetical protein SAMN04488103_101218 [Gemmobacter aquatilis]
MTADPLALEALLDRMHEALQGGDLAALESLAGPLADAGATLAPPQSRATLERLRRKAARNDTLLAASLCGLRAAQRRIAELRSLEQGFSTYDGAGLKHRHPQDRGALSKRF